jgi:hypothetical protein
MDVYGVALTFNTKKLFKELKIGEDVEVETPYDVFDCKVTKVEHVKDQKTGKIKTVVTLTAHSDR